MSPPGVLMPRIEKGMDPDEDFHRTLRFFLDDNDGLVTVRTPVWYKNPRLICSCAIWQDEKTCDHSEWVAENVPRWEEVWGLHPIYLTPDRFWRERLRTLVIPHLTAMSASDRLIMNMRNIDAQW